MKVIAKKTERKALILINLVIGVLILGAAFIVLPLGIFLKDPELLKNVYLVVTVLIAMLFFGLVGYFGFIRQLVLFKKAPAIQAETDGTYLYIYGKKEAKIPLKDLAGGDAVEVIPYIMSYEFIIHLISEEYGKVVLKVPNYGKFKLYFISKARDVAVEFLELIQKASIEEK